MKSPLNIEETAARYCLNEAPELKEELIAFDQFIWQDCKINTTEDLVASVTTATGESRPAVTPQRPKLPYFFKKALYENGMAVSKYYDILHQSERYMNGRLTEAEKYRMEFKLYKKWKWNHLRVAFEKTGFINRNIPKKHFAEYIHQVFPYITVDSITRSIQRYNENDNGFDYIVRQIVTEFSEVAEMTV